MANQETVDILIVGSGMGGATLAAGLAPTGARILILERGARLRDSADARDARAIFQRGVFRPQETWLDGAGQPFNPGNYYYVGGNSKLYGAVLLRYRAQDFAPVVYREGATPGWPFSYEELEPWYDRAEKLYNVRGAIGLRPDGAAHSDALSFRARAGRAGDRQSPRAHEARRAAPLSPSARRRHREMAQARARRPGTPSPTRGLARWTRRPAVSTKRLLIRNVELRENAQRRAAAPRARTANAIAGVEASIAGERKAISAGIVVLAAGAVNSAALLLRSGEGGIANRSDAVGRHFMNHNCSAVLAIDPRTVNDSVYQKTLGINDFYLDDGRGGPPLGNIQLLGRVTAPILKASIPRAPEWALNLMSRRSVDWYAMSEDLPSPESRVTLQGGQIRLDWRRSNWSAHEGLVKAFKERLRAAGYPIVLSKPFDRRTPSHQCGTVRIGSNPATSPLDPYCRAWDHPNLFVVDASFLPTSAAVNPSLTIAAQALRVADHIAKTDLRTA